MDEVVVEEEVVVKNELETSTPPMVEVFLNSDDAEDVLITDDFKSETNNFVQPERDPFSDIETVENELSTSISHPLTIAAQCVNIDPCHVCGKILSSRSSMKRHIQYHQRVKCTICSAILASDKKLKSHIEFHNSGVLQKCRYCDKYFIGEQAVSAHVAEKHNDTNLEEKAPKDVVAFPYRCNLCFKGFDRQRSLKKHKLLRRKNSKECEKPKFQCDKCKLIFDSNSKLRSHKEVHYKTWSCKYCNKKFFTREIRRAHVRNHEFSDPQTCPICESVYYDNSIFQSHVKSHNNYRSRKEDNQYSGDLSREANESKEKIEITSDDTFSLSIKIEKKYDCFICGLSFKLNEMLNEHMREHDGLYNCSYCELTFTNRLRMNQHIKLKHDILDLYDCNSCMERFTTHLSLCNHVKKVHNNQNLFECDYCKKTFYMKSTLENHIIKHTNTEFMKCPKCPKVIRGPGRLYVHLKFHDKPNKCQYCGDEFSYKNDLTKHIGQNHRSELPNVCNTCKRSFLTPNQLTQHIKQHKKMKNKACEICGKRLKTGNAYSAHIQRHKKIITGTPDELSN